MADADWPDDLDGLAGAVASRDGGSGCRALIDALPQIVWVTRPDGSLLHVNRQWQDFTGLTVQEALGSGWSLAIHPDDRGQAAVLWEGATSAGESYEIEHRLRRHDGVYRWMLGRAMPLRDEAGAVVAWFGTCTDIEDLKRARADLDQSRALQRAAGSVARLGGWSLDVVTNQAVWSEEIYEILDYPMGTEVVVEEALDQYLAEDRRRLVAALEACARAGTPFDLELQLETRLGRRLWARVIGEARYGPDGTVSHITGAHQDITAQKEADSQVRLLVERMTTTLESVTDAFFTLDRGWRLTYVNRRAEEVLRRSREELIGQNLWEAFPPAVGGVLDEVYHRAMHTGVSEVIEDFYWEPLDIWLSVHVYPSEQGLAVYFRDISDQHANQQALRRLNEELAEANRQLEDAARFKDDLLSMASHELRTPLTPILGFLAVLRSRAVDLTSEQGKMMLEAMDRQAGRMLRLVDDLLVVSRATAGRIDTRPQEVAAHEVLSPLVEELADDRVHIELSVEGCLLVVDPQHLRQIMLNLLTNAIKYGAAPIVVRAARAGEARVVLEVADDGPGIAPDFQHRMWERFVQYDRGDTRTAKGVGLGLAIVKLLTEANGGVVGYRNGSPGGAVFTIELPGRMTPQDPVNATPDADR